jgi:chloramphenicol-sensitive protein RarD
MVGRRGRPRAVACRAVVDTVVGEEVRTGIRAAVLAYVVWGLLTIYWKRLETFDPFELIAWRILCSTLVMTVVVTARGRWSVVIAALRDRPTARRLAAAAVLLTANWTSYVWAVSNDRVLEAALGYFMAPLVTMVLGIVALGEPSSRMHRAALALAGAAVVVLTVSYGRPPWLALVIAGSWSTYGLLKRRMVMSPVESLAGETFLLTIPALGVAVLFAGHAGSIPSTATGGQWVLVALTGVVTAVPLLLFAYAAQRVPFTLLGALQYLVPTINLVLGWVVYGEAMPPTRLIGFALVWVGLVLVTIDRVGTPAQRAARAAARGLSPTAGG